MWRMNQNVSEVIEGFEVLKFYKTRKPQYYHSILNEYIH